jgi:hypothetical protein
MRSLPAPSKLRDFTTFFPSQLPDPQPRSSESRGNLIEEQSMSVAAVDFGAQSSLDDREMAARKPQTNVSFESTLDRPVVKPHYHKRHVHLTEFEKWRSGFLAPR